MGLHVHLDRVFRDNYQRQGPEVQRKNNLIINAGDTLTFPENIEHNIVSSMSGESALYRIIATDDPAGPTWEV